MQFRVILSNNVDEYYKKNSTDIQMSMTVDAHSFKAAELKAMHTLTAMLLWPRQFEVVSITKVDEVWEETDSLKDIPEVKSVREPEEDAELFEKPYIFISKEPVKKAPEIWCLDTGIQILDPDGWNRKDLESWYIPITRDEFIKRAMMSTCLVWPKPLWDEPGGEI